MGCYLHICAKGFPRTFDLRVALQFHASYCLSTFKELEGTLFIIMEYISLCSIVFFYIAVGAQWRASRFEATAIGSFICLLAMVLPVISYCSVFDLKWYWAALLNFFAIFVASPVLSWIYCSVFGRRTPLHYNYEKQKECREHLYEYDMLITVGIALALFIISLF